MFVVKFTQNSSTPWFGFLKPYNAVRDDETYSLTYLTPSILNGIEVEHNIPMDSIVRNKLVFNGQQKEQVKTHTYRKYKSRNKLIDVEDVSIHKIYKLVNPVIYLAFNDKDIAEEMSNNIIYCGRYEYPLYSNGVEEHSDEWFDAIEGTEITSVNENDENSIFCGFNRFKNDEKMFINIQRN